MKEGMEGINGNGKHKEKSYIVADENYMVRATMVASLLDKHRLFYCHHSLNNTV